MATENKDFKVKNGLVVGEGGTFGGTVSVATPTSDSHVATKGYVDTVASSSGGVVVSDTEPESPTSGMIWFDTTINYPKIFVQEEWQILAMYSDTLSVADHVHDTSIDGSGTVTATYIDAGSPLTSYFIQEFDAQFAATAEWAEVISAGEV